jgi:hypothetical protein
MARHKVAVQNILYSKGHQCFKLKGDQMENDRYWQKKTFYFLKMFENVQCFCICSQSLLCYHYPKKSSCKNNKMGIKKAKNCSLKT